MSAEAAIAVRSWAVGDRTVTLTLRRPKPGAVIHTTAEWSPSEPARLTTEEWRAYRFGRNTALAELAAELGTTIAVVEV